MVDLASGLDGCSRPAIKHQWGWAALAEGLRVSVGLGLRNLRRADDAHDRLCRSRVVSEETVRDVGLSREDILGEPTWQADLPFFMQRHFR